MARYIQRPENALKRANEFIDVGKPARALDTLQEVFRNKKWTYTWSESVIEPIMFKYLDLCVELKKSHIAKEGLFQYRNIFQLVNVGSLENVIRGYLRMAEERTEAAQQQSSQAILDIDDLDNLTTPENILMSAVCGEDAQDRSDRTILLPWVKFLWESYCQCLELLRVNSHCETLYHDIARMAFQFCLKYNRKMEFRKLCDKLRKHLEDISKVSTQSANVSISKPETQQLNLDTRLHQLDSAIQMELWQEAYKAIEDIHGLMALSKKTPVPKTMAQYYQKLAMVFWKAGNQLFHAAALLKLFQLSRDMKKNVTAEELQKMASHVLVATLAIPLPSAHPEFDRFIETDKSPLEKAQRLAVLLALSQPPSRASLLKDLMRLNVVQLAAPQFQNLHKWLEVDFHPLSLCNLVQSIIDEIKTDENNPLIQYIQALQDVTLVRLVRQVSQVYQSIEFTRFLELAKFATSFYLERILVDCVRHNDMQITIDHKLKCIHFGTDLSESQRQDHPDGPTLQSMPSEQIRSQLVNMSVVLHRAIATINPNRKKAEREKMRNQMVQIYHDTKVKEHQRILQRQKIIEDRKEYIERMNTEREEEELRRQEEEQRKLKLAEAQRLQQEMEERERKRHANEIQQIKDRNLKEKMQQISQTRHGQKVLQKLDEEEIKKLDAEQIAAREAEELLRERKELQSKLKSQEKKIDYYERAKRIEEIPLIEQFLADKQVQDKDFWEKQEQLRIETAIAERKNAVQQQDRLKRMQPDREIFWEQLRAERNSMYVEKLKKFEVFLEEERKKRLAQRVVERREERRQLWIREKEEEQRRIEDEIRREKEELERIEKEKRDKEREVEAEKLRLINEKRLAREEEIERKLEEEREQNRVAINREKEQWRNEESGKQQDSDWRSRAPAAAATDAAPKTEAWRSTRNRDGEGRKDERPMRRDDRGEFRRSDKDAPIRRGGDDRDAPIRRGGDDRDAPIRRGGDDRDAPIRRGGDDRDAPIRRGGDDRDAPMRRGGDDRDGPIRRGGNDRDAPMRRGGDDRDAPIRRGGDDRDAPMRRGGDDRNNDFRRGGDDRFGRRDARKTDSNDSWRRGPPKDDDKSRRPGATGDRDRNRGPSNRGDDNWRSGAAADSEDDRKERPKADKGASRGAAAGNDSADSGWTDVKRR